jgi:hypothetical protein
VAASKVDAVFVAEVVERFPIDRGPHMTLFRHQTRNRMRVHEAFRGDVGAEIDVYTDSGSSCSFGFRDGVLYVVYANRDADGRLTTGMCSRTHTVESDDGDLVYLRAAAQAPVPTHGLIVGRAVVARVGVPLTGVQVVAESGTARYETHAGSDGSYSLAVPRGSYVVRYIVGDGLHSSEAQVVVARDGSCVAPETSVSADGRLTGRVVDSRGSPIADISVFLADVTPGVGSPFTLHKAITEAEGVYRMARLYPGQFLLGIGVSSYNLGDATNVYSPGVVDHTRATPFSLDLGENKMLPDLVIPAGVQLVTVSGTVRSLTGTPVVGARVALIGTYWLRYSTERATREAVEAVTTDRDGRYIIRALAGAYSVTASPGGKQYNPVARSEPFESSGPVEIDLTLPD